MTEPTWDGRPGVPVTVADVLTLDALQGADVVAGRAGLSRIVTGVNIIEVPDVWQWLRGGEFLLSAAYAWREDLEKLVPLLHKLGQAGISAVGFKLGRYVEELPDQVLAVADRLGLPVILLPSEVAYRDVFEPLYERLLTRPGREFAPARRVDQALLRFGLDDQSIEKIAGALAVLDPDSADEAHLEPAITQAAELISFLLLKRLAFLEGRREASNVFFESLMSDALSNEEATERALSFGLRLSRKCIVVMIGFLAGGGLDAEQWSILRHRLERRLAPRPGVITADLANNLLRGIFQMQDDHDQLLHAILQSLRGFAGEGRRPLVAVGAPAAGLEGVRRSRSEALIALETGLRLGRDGVIEFAELGVERVLVQIPPGHVSQGYVEALLGPIEGDDELLRTLELYLQHGGNKSATAAAVPLHRSSLLYRLEKISARLGVNLDDPEQRHELWLALRLRRVSSRPR